MRRGARNLRGIGVENGDLRLRKRAARALADHPDNWCHINGFRERRILEGNGPAHTLDLSVT